MSGLRIGIFAPFSYAQADTMCTALCTLLLCFIMGYNVAQTLGDKFELTLFFHRQVSHQNIDAKA